MLPIILLRDWPSYRHTRPPLAVNAKLMALDYILANREQRFLATEKEKIGYFTGAHRIGIDKLPTKIYRSGGVQSATHQYFVDKIPIFIRAELRSLSAPVVSSCYVAEGVVSTPFEAAERKPF